MLVHARRDWALSHACGLRRRGLAALLLEQWGSSIRGIRGLLVLGLVLKGHGLAVGEARRVR